jgi:hypothetical protein
VKYGHPIGDQLSADLGVVQLQHHVLLSIEYLYVELLEVKLHEGTP